MVVCVAVCGSERVCVREQCVGVRGQCVSVRE